MKSVTVSYNARFLASRHPTGTHRSALEFLKVLALEAQEQSFDLHVFGPPPEDAFTSLDTLPSLNRHPVAAGRMPAWKWHRWEQFSWPRQARGVAINPLNTGPFILPAKRHIVFSHDINFLKIPGSFGWKFRLWNRFATVVAMKRAGRLVCFTDHVKRDLVERLQIESSKITVIPQGPGLPLGRPLAPLVDKKPYFLCVGSLQPHKNFRVCLEAWREANLAARGYTLKVVGKPQANFAPVGVSEDLKEQPGIEFTGYIENEELVELYRHCTGFLYPSLEEGFGLPVVEAFYLGAPVVTSSRSCLPEVAGGAALLVNPSKFGELATALLRLADDSQCRARLMRAGEIRAMDFTWERAGKALAAVVREHHNASYT